MTTPVAALVRVSTEAVASIDRRLFGSFVEHMGRCVETGIHEPGHLTADAEGFRGDVLDLVRELGVTIVRYPGGNFVSGYRWEDGVGPVQDRPRRLDTAWHEIETNAVGLHEFVSWARRAGVEVMEAVNLGTRGIEDAMRLVEYANHPGGTQLSDLRARNGAAEPFGIRLWCLGNEMDGPWQLGAKTADEYGRLARETAKGMRAIDPGIELVLAGSSSPDMPTFGEWERVVLEHAYEHVDYLSLHFYVQERPGQLVGFLSSAERLDAYIGEVIAIVDDARERGGHEKVVHLALDEWNVWNQDAFNDPDHQAGVSAGPWREHPRIIEDAYTVTDAVVVATMLHTILRRAGRVRIANLAQLVNVIAPIMTEPGGPAWRQTTFGPLARIHALARGEVVALETDSPPLAHDEGGLPALDAVATMDAASGQGALFLANRSPSDALAVTVELPDGWRTALVEVLRAPQGDRRASNTLDDPARVVLSEMQVEPDDLGVVVTLPAISWACIRLTSQS